MVRSSYTCEDMKKPESYDVRVKGRLVLSNGSMEDAMEIIQDLSKGTIIIQVNQTQVQLQWS